MSDESNRAARKHVFVAYMAVMQDAEGRDGPEGDEYLGVMQEIIADAQQRIDNYLSISEKVT